ncbi:MULTISPECIES: hypothetical protein [unclassified Mycobacterium]|uniref:hypothetical protein n=1 Tax=unclassified Mycobacterium TaxID=2642494 RepID=UPI000AC0A963|nr:MULTISPECIES: hypothetical protein [unclassified Mycobacterium]
MRRVSVGRRSFEREKHRKALPNTVRAVGFRAQAFLKRKADDVAPGVPTTAKTPVNHQKDVNTALATPELLARRILAAAGGY